MKTKRIASSSNGSTLVGVLIIVAILSFLAGSALFSTTNRRLTLSQAQTWQQALVAAEAGAHQAMAQIDRGLYSANALPSISGTQTFSLSLSQSGEGQSTSNAVYSISGSNAGTSSSPRYIYRIISTGSAQLPGGRSLSADFRDAVLRKLNLGTSPRSAVRRIEVRVRPSLNTDVAIATDGAINLNGKPIAVDSFDSHDSTRSYNFNSTLGFGLPHPTVIGMYNDAQHMNATLASNSPYVHTGLATIYGDILTNGGPEPSDRNNVLGEFRNDYYKPLAPVFVPTWYKTGAYTVIRPSDVSKPVSGGPVANPNLYVIQGDLKLAGANDILNISNPSGVSNDNKYVEIYVTGDLSTQPGALDTSGGRIVIASSMNVKFYVGGNVDVTGNGLVNNTLDASALAFYGITPSSGSTAPTWKLAGGPSFYGTWYAPGANLVLSGGGNAEAGNFIGNLVGKTATLNGSVKVRYDEHLANTGSIVGYVITSWFEDTRKIQ